MLLATFWFACMNVIVKMLAHLPTMELVFFRCGIAALIGWFLLHKNKIGWRGSNRKLLLLRGLFGTLALYTFFFTLQRMPLGTAVTIQYLSPFFTSLLAVFILKENMRPVQWVWFALSFSGVLLIKGFNASVSWWLLGLGIASAILSALAYNMVRTLREKEHPLVVVLHFQLFGWVAGAGFSLYDFRMPEGMEWALLLLMGLFTQWGQENLTRSLQAEPANKVTILNYTGVLYAMLFGYLLFDETYGWPELLGTLLVISGMTLNILSENSKKRASL